MDDEIKQLKSLLRSLVVSSPTQMDVRSLLRDYRNMVGEPIPIAKFGHKDPVAFLRERCNDSFLFTGPSSNPVLTLIVPDTLKHIDQFVQRQKVPSTSKFKSKRRSVPEAAVAVPKDNIFKSFVSRNSSAPAPAAVPAPVPTHAPAPVPAPAPSAVPAAAAAPTVRARTAPPRGSTDPETNRNNTVTSNDVQNFLKKRIPQYIDLQAIDDGTDGTGSLALDDDELDSGRHTSSSSASTKARQLEELKAEIMELISAAPGGVWCTDLIRLYRERFERELNFKRFGYNSILSVAYTLEPRVAIARPDPTGDWLLQDRARAPAPRARPQPRAPPAPPAPAPDPDDALPGIDFDPDVFPEDCVSFCDSIPPLALDDCVPGAMLEVIVGEVYSPSHFWLIRLGQNYNIAMEDMMDDMTRYYNGPGAARALARGAVRVGHYCSSLYENDWHRSLIVKILDSDTVKVRHVDYGTVDTVRVAALRPLRRCWARLPAQAVRARLAAVRPCSAGRRWPPPAARHFLGLVQDARFVANVVARDLQEELLEVLLIDTRAEDDRCVSAALVRAGHADPRADSALRVSASLSDLSASDAAPPRRLRTWDAEREPPAAAPAAPPAAPLAAPPAAPPAAPRLLRLLELRRLHAQPAAASPRRHRLAPV